MANSMVMLLRDVNETLAYETETFVFGRRRDWDQDLRAISWDRDVWFLPRDETETWHKCCRESRQSKCTLFSHLT